MVLSGKYRLLATVGEGGMGAVWRAEDLHLGAPVAVKLIHERDVNNAEVLARFEAEAEIAAQLRSPHVVQVFDAGVDRETGWPFIAMEFLEGESLRERLGRVRTLSPAVVVQLVAQAARALTRAHEIGIIHRDLKPANVFLLRDGDRDVVKLLDFGIAKRTNGFRLGPTMTGDLLGTPTYMSPEQIVSSRDVDYRTDLWSLAVIVSECLTGKLPFDCDNLPGLALMICQGQSTLPSRLGRVPPGFDAWFLRATQARAADRFASASEMAEELRRVCDVERVRQSQLQLEGASLYSTPASPAQLSPASERVDMRVSPSVGPTTTPVARQLDAAQRRQRRFRRAALAGVAALLGAGLYALVPAAQRTDTNVAAIQPERGPDPDPALALPAQNPPRETPRPSSAQPTTTEGGGAGASVQKPSSQTPKVALVPTAPRALPTKPARARAKLKRMPRDDPDNFGF